MTNEVNFNQIPEVVVLAALLHDIGKSNIAFQERLQKKQAGGDYYRHEWLSLKLFVLMVSGDKTDQSWLMRFSQIDTVGVISDGWLAQAIEDEVENNTFDYSKIDTLPPLAQWVAWLIVTHHRLPPSTNTDQKSGNKQKIKLKRLFDINTCQRNNVSTLYSNLDSFDNWQKNPVVAVKDPLRARKSHQIKKIVTDSQPWREALALWSSNALKNPLLFNADGTATFKHPINDTYLLSLSRLALILSDHNYSSLAINDKRRIVQISRFSDMYANSNRHNNSVRQSLDEHLVGVASFCDSLIKTLPNTLQALPTLKNHNALSQNTTVDRFGWQNAAYYSALSLRKHSESHGFFGINLASTGCGKTIANARIMYALSDANKGARFTVALGLRILTLQTGQQFRDKLSLSSDQVAVVIGGNQENLTVDEMPSSTRVIGSESAYPLYDQNIDGGYNTSLYTGLDTILNDEKASKLMLSPIVTCTIDHLMQSCESLRGGSHIPPTLRLLSSDLILDEPDDFAVEDLYALSRLVHTAGLLGSRVMLSSATITPSIAIFLFDAYTQGREVYNQNHNMPIGDDLKVACLITDEQTSNTYLCDHHEEMAQAYDDFAKQRVDYLAKLPARRVGEIVPISAHYDKEFPDSFYEEVTQTLVDKACQLHERYHEYDQNTKISVGLVRLTYTKSIIAVAKAIASSSYIPKDTHVHICCYHSRQVLALRSELESRLDVILNRSDPNQRLIQCEDIAQAVTAHSAKNHIFIVLATPICEVGRDHDYDWSIVEPSSMRSIIQLAGRVWRHRPNKHTDNGANIAILQYNLKTFTRQANPYSDQKVFTHPGFESDDNTLSTYDIKDLLKPDLLDQIDSKSRIIENTDHSSKSLVGLEHNRLKQVLNVNECCIANGKWHKNSRMYALCTDIQVLTPFRDSDQNFIEYTVVAAAGKPLDFYLSKQLKGASFETAALQNHIISQTDFISLNSQLSLWLEQDMNTVLDKLVQKKPSIERDTIIKEYFTASLRDSRFSYNEFLGFYED